MLHPKRMPLPPPPYSGSPSNASYAPSTFHFPATLEPRKLVDPSNMPSRSRTLPAPPELWLSPIVTQVPAGRQFPSPVIGSTSPLSSPHSFTTGSNSSHSHSYPPPPQPPLPTATTISLPPPRPRSNSTKTRSALPSKLSKATRNATAWFGTRKSPTEAMSDDEQKKRPATAESEAAAMATRMRAEEDPWKAAIRTKAGESVRSSIQSLLSRGLPNECDLVLKRCEKICADGGLELSAVLQEPLIDGKPPVYWAILNGPTTTDTALHALVLSLLETCQPLRETTVASIRLACMLTSNNALLQHLFWNFPPLSPLSRGDAMLLSSVGGGDVVTVNETQDGIGTFVARIQIRRFRLRMRVSKIAKVEFVTSDRIWTVIFSVGANNAQIGQSDSQWLLSFGLGDHSMPVGVDGDFLVLRRSSSVGGGDDFEPIFSLPLGHNPCQLQPGPERAIKMRLDEGPLRPHLLNESMALVDRDGTLHIQFNVKLVQARHPTTLRPPSIDFSDGASVRSSAQKSTRSKAPRSKTKDKQNRDVPDKEKRVYTSLRRGGR